MTIAAVLRQYDYGYWANRRLFTIIGQLTVDEFTRPVAGSLGSIRNTLVHMMSTEWGWLERCGGPVRGAEFVAAQYPTLEAVVEAWAAIEAMVRAFLASCSEDDLAREVAYPNSAGEVRMMILGQLLQHAANHGVHHRGQVALLIRALGHTPGNVDLLFYDAEQRGVSAW